VRRIRAAANGEATRVVTIDLKTTCSMPPGVCESGAIFFDLHAAKLTPESGARKYSRGGRPADGAAGGAESSGRGRVVLDVDGVKEYTASLTNNPTQLLIDLYANSGRPRCARPKAKRGEQTEAKTRAKDRTAQAKSVQNVAARKFE